MSAEDELVDVVDDADQVTGRVSRREMRARKLRHRAVYVLVFNSRQQLFVHQRSANKDIYPSFYDVAVGGVVSAGEDYDRAAARELREELGVSGVPLRRLFPFRYSGTDGLAVNGMLYSCSYQGPLKLQESEIQSGDWMDLDQALDLARSRLVCPDSLQALRLYVDRLAAAARRRGLAT